MADFPIKAEMQKHVSNIMSEGMDLVDLFVNKNYLIDLERCEPIPLAAEEKSFVAMSLFQIDKIVYDRNENINDKLVSVYSSLSNFGSSAILIISSDSKGVKFYMGTRDMKEPRLAKEILKKSLHGNFPGINIKEERVDVVKKILEDRIPDVYSNMSVSAVSIVPSMRDEDDKDGFVQGVEKFIDSMAGEEYTAVFVSSPLSKQELEDKKRGYEELYSALSQCSQLVMTYGENDSESVADGISKSFSKAINDGISDTTGKNTGTNKSKARNSGGGFSFGLFGTGFNRNHGKTTSSGSFDGSSEAHATTHSESNTNTKGTSTTNTKTTGANTSIQITRHNKTVEELLNKIDEQLARIRTCESYGLWNSACYFISKRQELSIVAANTYKALVAGENTSVENSFINFWDDSYENSDKTLEIMNYLRYGMHPKFTYKPGFASLDYDKQEISAASLISGLELPILMGLPHKSVVGLTSIESAEFGRNIFVKSNSRAHREINIGAIYHMGEVFEQNRIRLNLESLTSHCFITGSTGSGKSNTTYKIIEELTSKKNKVKFLVIEPAKGEYKLAFGDMPDINIFTTNPMYYSMLSINPFEFNEEIHVLEHLDRLIEIFSACWPLYAAMPAVLKSAFERSYIMHGWDLNHSLHTDIGNSKFPNFKDIVKILPKILEESDYSAEAKANYVGSLVTRVESLTNGLLGQVFNNASIDDEILFEQNTIVDLSRVGSTETKALIMGILVLKLSEFRQATSIGVNIPLKHVTIMEEAHNLLKRTSTEQGQESSNLQGKSVEMISNSIAEMRTYGEGFIIVDQSPTAVDISSIKNTNTKIIMRLPETIDCETVGRSIALNDEQIRELSKLDRGVAVVFQNDWIEPVLAKVDKCSSRYEVDLPIKNNLDNRREFLGELLGELIIQHEDGDFKMHWINGIVKKARVDKMYKLSIEKLLLEYQRQHVGGNTKGFADLLVDLLNCEDLIRINERFLPPPIKKKDEMTAEHVHRAKKWISTMSKGLDKYAKFYDEHTKEMIIFNIALRQRRILKNNAPYIFVLHVIKNKL